MKKKAWQLFSQTGNIAHYMLYRAMGDEDAENYYGHDD